MQVASLEIVCCSESLSNGLQILFIVYELQGGDGAVVSLQSAQDTKKQVTEDTRDSNLVWLVSHELIS